MPQAGCVFSVDQTFERWNLRSFEIPKYGYILPFKTLWSMKLLFEGETSVWNNEGLGSWGTHVSCWFARFRCGLGRRLGWKGGVRVVRQLVWVFCWVSARRNDTVIWFLYILTYFRDMPNLDFHSSQQCGFWIKTFWQHMWSKKRKWFLNFYYALVDSCAISYSMTLECNLSILPWLSPSERNNDISSYYQWTIYYPTPRPTC